MFVIGGLKKNTICTTTCQQQTGGSYEASNSDSDATHSGRQGLQEATEQLTELPTIATATKRMTDVTIDQTEPKPDNTIKKSDTNTHKKHAHAHTKKHTHTH
jgi:hypothetical protein